MNEEQEENIPDEIRLSDLLEQIEKVNKMIDLHRGDEFMEGQYRHIKSRFVSEMQEILLRYEVFVYGEPQVAA